MSLEKDERVITARNWWQAWNDRDLENLVAMIAEDSRLATLHEFYDPISVDGMRLTGTRYVRARFQRDISKLNKTGITFKEPEKILVGDHFVELRYQLSDGKPVREILSLNKDGLIDQVMRYISDTAWM